MNLFRGLLLSVLLLGAARAGSPEVVLLRPGEELTYRVSWGWFGQAGELKVAALCCSICAATNDHSLGIPAIAKGAPSGHGDYVHLAQHLSELLTDQRARVLRMQVVGK